MDFQFYASRYYRTLLNNHIVIIGYNKVVADIINQLYDRDKKYWFLILTSKKSKDVWFDLSGKLSKEILNSVLINQGHPNDIDSLEKLHIENCQKIYLLGEENEDEHDAQNIDTLIKVNQVIGDKTEVIKVNCHVLFYHLSTLDILSQNKIKEHQYLIIKPFNYEQLWADRVLNSNRGERDSNFLPIDRNGINKDSQKYVHFIIIGMTQMGIAMGNKAAEICHYPNHKKTRITFIDEQADILLDKYVSEYKGLWERNYYEYIDTECTTHNQSNINTYNKQTDIDFQFIKGAPENKAVQELINNWADKSHVNKLLSIAICTDNSQRNTDIAYYFPKNIYKNNIPVFVYQKESCAIINLLHENPDYSSLRAFGYTK